MRHCNKAENRKSNRIKDKEKKSANGSCIDAKTRSILSKWINAGVFDSIKSVIAMGKESTVLYAEMLGEKKEILDEKIETLEFDTIDKHEECLNLPVTQDHVTGYAIKVFKSSLIGFKNRSEYVKDDFRFKNYRRIIKIWAEKEFMNLNRLFCIYYIKKINFFKLAKSKHYVSNSYTIKKTRNINVINWQQ